MQGAQASAQGTDFCASGYHHGVIESVMMRIGRDEIRARALSVCAEPRADTPRSYMHYNCVHGMGHGFMAVLDSDVFRALSACDTLPDAWEQSHCYGGVFMENQSAFGRSGERSTYLRPAAPLYPCTAVDTRYKSECYVEQTGYALLVHNDDFDAVFRLCQTDADVDFRHICYQGLGGDAAIMASKYVHAAVQGETVSRLCSQGPDHQGRSECVVGAVTTMVRDLSGNDAPAQNFCASILDTTLHAVCDDARRVEMQSFRNGSHTHTHTHHQ
jgi:hypothetical protein